MRRVVVTTISLVVLGAASSRAELITYTFAGTSQSNYAPAGVTFGSPLIASVTFDSDTPGFTGQTLSAYYGAVTNFRIEFGGAVYNPLDYPAMRGEVDVFNNFNSGAGPFDYMRIYLGRAGVGAVTRPDFQQVLIELTGPATTLSSSRLPTGPAPFSTINFTFTYPSSSAPLLFASATFSAVPEPTSLALFGAGVSGLGLATRRRHFGTKQTS